MSDFIEDFYYGNIEPQECKTCLTPKLKKNLNELTDKEEHLTSSHTYFATLSAPIVKQPEYQSMWQKN